MMDDYSYDSFRVNDTGRKTKRCLPKRCSWTFTLVAFNTVLLIGMCVVLFFVYQNLDQEVGSYITTIDDKAQTIKNDVIQINKKVQSIESMAANVEQQVNNFSKFLNNMCQKYQGVCS